MRKTFFLLWMVLLSFAACQDDGLVKSNDSEDPSGTELVIDQYALKGVVRIKLSTEFVDSFNPVVTRSGAVTTGLPELDRVAQALGATGMVRTFPYSRKYDARHRKAGLHLWYDVVFDETQPVTRALNDLKTIEGVELVEPVREIVRTGNTGDPVVLTEAMIQAFSQNTASTRSPGHNAYFNDPYLDLQWHYNNEGLLPGGVTGSDINLFPAWDMETGKPDVIVAVVDGGIQYDHPDLAANMWVNVAELNGTAGVDDDGNGYVDDIYGYNFLPSYVNPNGAITAHYHGTHVAGTVGAVNNNNMGVAGVAGGTGSSNSGIRMMSCQIFGIVNGYEYSATNPGACMVYAADNGAVISQNSWGYLWNGVDQDMPAADKAGIDYFIDYAGTDETGLIQTGPMKGGIVIFASGNDNISGISMPGAYERVLSVSAIGPNYRKASYSNYGNWVDLCAPGGDDGFSNETYSGLVLSTYPGGRYAYMAGTSMACPHVSGIAALVVSKYGGADFTSEKLWNRLMYGTNAIDRFETAYNIGVGYINAQKVLAGQGEIAPNRVYDLKIAGSTFEYVELAWSITSDADNGLPERYDVVYSTSPIYRVNPSALPAGAELMRCRVADGASAGNTMTARINTLTAGETYYFAVAGIDRDGNYAPSATVSGGTLAANLPPVVEGLPGNIALKRAETLTLNLNIYDPEGYGWAYTFDPGSAALKGERVKETNSFILTFDAYAETPGNYKALLVLTDTQGMTNVVEILYSIAVNHAPTLVPPFEQILLYNAGLEKHLDLNSYLSDIDGDELTYSARSDNPSAISVSVASGTLRITPLTYGSAGITVTAMDEVGAKLDASFEVICRNPSQAVDLYPAPVRPDGILNIRMGEEVKGNITVSLYNSSGARVFSKETAIAPDAPARVDISALSTGNYRVTVKYKISEYSKTITKL